MERRGAGHPLASAPRTTGSVMDAHAQPEENIEFALTRDPHAAREARAAVRELLPTHEDEQLVADAELVVSELVSNVLNHTADGGTLRAWRTGHGLHIEVADTELEVPTVAAPVPDRVGGLGMHVVDRL